MNFTNNHRIIFLYSIVFILVCLITVYIPVWLYKSVNLSLEKIGVLIGITSFLKIFSNLIMTKFISSMKEQKFVLIIITITILCIFFYFILLENLQDWKVSFFAFMMLVLFSPILPITENINIAINKSFHTTYGKLRLSGSVTFCIAVVIFGFIVDKYGADLVPLLCIIFFLKFLLIIFLIPNKEKEKSCILRSSISKLLGDKNFIITLLSCSIILASHAMYYSFSAIYWKNSNMNLTQVGFLWSFGILAEIVFFMFIDKIKIKNIFFHAVTFVGFVSVIRWILTFLFNNFFILIFIQCLHAFTFGLAHYLVMYYIYTKVENNNKLIAQSFYYALSSGIIMSFFTIAAGLSFKYNSNGEGFLLMAGFCFISIVLIIPKILVKKNEIKK